MSELDLLPPPSPADERPAPAPEPPLPPAATREETGDAAPLATSAPDDVRTADVTRTDAASDTDGDDSVRAEETVVESADGADAEAPLGAPGEPSVPVAGVPRESGEPAPDAPLPEGLAPLVELLARRAHDPATIRELLQIQREHRADLAREAYNEALARFRAVAPTLPKDREVHFASRDKGRGTTHYRHTSIGYAMGTVNPLLGRLGLNISWHPRVTDGVIHVETRLTHALGHSESITLPGMPDTSGNKNAIQAMKSTITYLERAGAFALLGLASSDDDDGRAAGGAPPEDATAAAERPISFDQAEDLANLLELIETFDPGYRERFVAHYAGIYPPGDNPLGLELPLERLPRARRMLKRKLADARAAVVGGEEAGANA